MTIYQISIFLENKYGKLSEILSILTQENIRIIAATVADTSEYGILRIIVNEPQKAFQLLKDNNISANISDVVAIQTDPTTEDFARTLTLLTKAGISIEYMYCFSVKEKAILILKTNKKHCSMKALVRYFRSLSLLSLFFVFAVLRRVFYPT